MFAEDTSAYFDTTTGFAQPCTVGGQSVGAIFDNGYTVGAVGPFGMATASPSLTLPTASVPPNPEGQACVVAGVSYIVATHEPDGTGISVLRLEKAA